MAMKVVQLEDELKACREPKTTARKPWLRRRLHAVILRAHLDDAAAAGNV